jgi:FkbM family methyltransferase
VGFEGSNSVRARPAALCRSIAVVAAALALSVQADEAPEKALVISHGVPVGEVWPGPEKKLYSQGNEELIVRDFFRDAREGVFLDVGCSEPIENSTTYYLEKHRGWSGIGIDALPEHAAAYAKERPRTRFFNYIVTDHSGTIEKFYRVKGTPGLSSTEKNRVFLGRKLRTDTIEVPTISLDDLLEQNGVSRIDFMSMDIEGGAPKALAGFDIEKYQPKLICIEAPGLEEFLEKYFAQHGYRRIDEYLKYDYANWYYTPVSRETPAEPGKPAPCGTPGRPCDPFLATARSTEPGEDQPGPAAIPRLR